jgi:hypothetical protein
VAAATVMTAMAARNRRTFTGPPESSCGDQ